MRNILSDIKEKLSAGEYKNEEHVRLNIVARLLYELGWNIWDPNEVNAEFIVAPDEDNTKVDLAIFTNKFSPTIFIEVKSVGKCDSKISETERQLRNYNRNNTALFSIITDGRKWLFYYSQTGGEFSQKCFKTIDIVTQDLDDVEISFNFFLSKEEIVSGRAKAEAEKYLKLTQEQKVMEDSLSEARRLIQEPPYPSLPYCLISLVKEKYGFEIKKEKVITFINEANEKNIPSSDELIIKSSPDIPYEPPTNIRKLNPQNPDSVKWTKVIEGKFDNERVDGWNPLLESSIRTAIRFGISIVELQNWVSTNIKNSHYNLEGYHSLPGTNVSIQRMNADNSLRNALIIAQKLKVEIKVSFKYGAKAYYANQEGLLHWQP